MDANSAIARAERLLERAVELEALQYGKFLLSSGETSAFYFDGRLLSTDPESVSIVSEIFIEALERKRIHSFGGPAMGAVPMIGAMALRAYQSNFDLSGFFVRSEPKRHGMGKMIEGTIPNESEAAIYDDTISTGGSMFKAVEALERGSDAKVRLAMCILNRKQGGDAELNRRGIMLFSILSKTTEETVNVDADNLRTWFK